MSKIINKALDIIEIVATNDGDSSLNSISKRVGINTATTYRILATLAKRSYVSHKKNSSSCRLGLKVMDFGYAIRKDFKFIDIALVRLSKLSNKYNPGVYSFVLDGDVSLVIEEVGNTGEMRINSPVGKRMPLHCTACGKILLSSMTEEQRREFYLLNTLGKYTKNTITQA